MFRIVATVSLFIMLVNSIKGKTIYNNNKMFQFFKLFIFILNLGEDCKINCKVYCQAKAKLFACLAYFKKEMDKDTQTCIKEFDDLKATLPNNHEAIFLKTCKNEICECEECLTPLNATICIKVEVKNGKDQKPKLIMKE